MQAEEVTHFNQCQSLFSKGFSLFELMIVLSLISVLVAVLLPKLTELQEDAHISSVRMTANSLQAAVNLTHSIWQSQGSQYSRLPLQGFGGDDVLMNRNGWPENALVKDADSTTSSDRKRNHSEAETCLRIWKALLKDSAPLISADSEGNSLFKAESFKGHCRYRYRIYQDELRIDYDPIKGRVFLISDSK